MLIKYQNETFYLTDEMIAKSSFIQALQEMNNENNDFTFEGDVFLHTLKYITNQITKEEYNNLLNWENLLFNKYLLNDCYLTKTNLEKVKTYYITKTKLMNDEMHSSNTFLLKTAKSNNSEVSNQIKNIIDLNSIVNVISNKDLMYIESLYHTIIEMNNYEIYYEQHKKYLSIDFSDCKVIKDVSALGMLHTLNLSKCKNIRDVSALGGVHTLDLSYTNITDISALGRVNILNLARCRELKDVSALGGVHTLDLSYTNITDISALGYVHTLVLRGCHNITDVSALGSVYKLDLTWCDGIMDVSKLGRVHTLNLSRCKNITDVSALGGVHTLDLSYCSNITDVSALGGVHNLNLSTCTNITDVSALGGVHTLDLSYCSNITDVSA